MHKPEMDPKKQMNLYLQDLFQKEMDSWTLSDVSTLNDKTYNEIEISNIKLSISVLKAMQPTTHEAAQ